ncbi:MAG: hypothetical protein LBL96_09390 [Clostridiales bacterium]|nr:hypothetical protein [Clostridiales bacterium]
MQDKRRALFAMISVVAVLFVLAEYIISLPKLLEFNYTWYPNSRFQDSVKDVYETTDISNGATIPIKFDGWGIWLPKEKILATVNGVRSVKPIGNTAQMSGLTDSNWESGLHNSEDILLFENTKQNQRNLMYYSGGHLSAGGAQVNITNVAVNGQWIWVMVDDRDSAKIISESGGTLYCYD